MEVGQIVSWEWYRLQRLPGCKCLYKIITIFNRDCEIQQYYICNVHRKKKVKKDPMLYYTFKKDLKPYPCSPIEVTYAYT